MTQHQIDLLVRRRTGRQLNRIERQLTARLFEQKPFGVFSASAAVFIKRRVRLGRDAEAAFFDFELAARPERAFDPHVEQVFKQRLSSGAFDDTERARDRFKRRDTLLVGLLAKPVARGRTGRELDLRNPVQGGLTYRDLARLPPAAVGHDQA